MKKNTIIFSLIIFIITITSFIVFSINTNYKYDNKNIIESNISNDSNKSNMISYMVEGETAGEYTQTTTNAWPDTSVYSFNAELSKCENGSRITWNSSTNKAEAFIKGTDNCYLYFDKPVYWNDNFSGTSYQAGSKPTTTYSSRELLASNYAQFASIPYYIKTTSEHQVCLWYNNHEFCLGANYWVGDSQDQTDGTTTKNKLKTEMESALGTSASSCNSSSVNANCGFGDFYCVAHLNGDVTCAGGNPYTKCEVHSDGNSSCGQFQW